ncbi:PGF-pre-PGF domain-containing protein [Methanococcoides methylutens]|uniref:PGF-pre-PGF domain-containing protein n=1 Tax=Methanococcoides methylutens TaxID=2226 RepID=UPI0040445F5D
MALVLMTAGIAVADTFTVNNSTGPVADYTSIQDAVDAAVDGDTILVYPGKYVENVAIVNFGTFPYFVQNLTIKSQSGDPHDTIVQADNLNNPVFSVISSGVTINGFTVIGGRGIDLLESDGELKNNIISDGGIFVDASHINVINNTMISIGISVYDVSEGILENNNVFSCSLGGITISNQAHGTLVNNTIYENDIGIVIDDFADGDIYNNTISGNEVGITIDGNSYGKIANNYFNNTMNAQIDVPYLGIYSTWNITKTAGTNIVGGPYLGGNYWANPEGTGFSQTGTDVDGDGICDSPYNINANNTDHLPLCIQNVPSAIPVADFTANVTEGQPSLTVQFTDLSLNATSLEWDFGDGSPRSSEQNPVHVYTKEGKYTVSLNASSSGGYNIETKVDYITVSIASSSTGGSSSSAGGGGGASGEAYENIAFKDVKTEDIIDGLEISYVFDDEQNPIRYINFSALRNYGRVSTTIEVLKDRSAMVDESAPGIVYGNFNIWVGKAGFATENNIADPVIGFSVAKAWLVENGVDENSIALYRHSEGKWNYLDTIKVGEDDPYIYFEAETPGFSPFAIVAFEEDESISIQESMPPSEVGVSPVEDKDTQPESRGIPSMSTGSLILVLVGVHLLMRKRS